MSKRREVVPHFVSVCLLLTWCTSVCSSEEKNLDDLLHSCQAVAQKICSFEMSYTYESSRGALSRVRLSVDGAKYRGERDDESANPRSDGRPGTPAFESWAYDNVRTYYLMRTADPVLILADGGSLEGRGYQHEVPLIWPYNWLKAPNSPLRWDTLVADENWDRLISCAKVIEPRTFGDQETIGIEMAHLNPGVTKCTYRIWLSPALGFLPLYRERVVDSTDEVSTTVEVQQYKIVDLDGLPFGFPTKVKIVETGRDGVSMKSEILLTVDESTLRVNQPVNQSLFKITAEPNWSVHDSSLQRRINNAVSQLPMPQTTFTPPQQLWGPWLYAASALVLSLCCTAAAWKLRT